MLNSLKETPLVPVLRKIAFEDHKAIIGSLLDARIKTIEITLDTDGALEIIQNTVKEYTNACVGAGTVLSKEDCEKAIDAGAAFIVSPVLNEGVIAYAVKRGIPVIPGVYSPTEMMKAHELGATAVKLFPATSVGPSFVKDVRGPLNHIPIMVTGGIDLNNARSYIHAGAIAVGAGGSLLKKEILANKDWTLLVEESKKWVSEVTNL